MALLPQVLIRLPSANSLAGRLILKLSYVRPFSLSHSASLLTRFCAASSPELR